MDDGVLVLVAGFENTSHVGGRGSRAVRAATSVRYLGDPIRSDLGAELKEG